MVTTIIGVGVVAVLQLLAAGTMANGDGAELTTGLTLARNVREMMLSLSFADPSFSNQWHPGSPPHWGPESGESSLAARDDLDDFDGVSISPPIDARRTSLTHYAGWAQADHGAERRSGPADQPRAQRHIAGHPRHRGGQPQQPKDMRVELDHVLHEIGFGNPHRCGAGGDA